MGRASKDKRDIYYRKAKEEGYRARSAYKLLQIDEEFDLFRGVVRAVDLCAAPGSWSQVLTAKLAPSPDRRIVAVDLQEMAPIHGVTILQGDITTEKTANQVIHELQSDNAATSVAELDQTVLTTSQSLSSSGKKAQLVICDGAPDVTGLHDLDEYVQHQLLLAALNITTFVLEKGGCFVTKMFRGPNTPYLIAKSEYFFENVIIVKPKSSRNASMEAFMLCQNYQPPVGFVPSMLDPIQALERYFPEGIEDEGAARGGCGSGEKEWHQLAKVPGATIEEKRLNAQITKFLACGDVSGYDADLCYDRVAGTVSLEPSHPPTEAPYLDANTREERKRKRKEEEEE